MKQKQYAPMSVAEQSLSIYAVDKGYMDDVPVNEDPAFEGPARPFMQHQGR
jgi:F-type H+-transporting ATPase subunit alpha